MLSHRVTLTLAAAAALAVSVLPIGPAGTLSAAPPLGAGIEALEEADLEVVLHFEQVPLSRIFEALEAASRTKFDLTGDFGQMLTDADLGRVTLSTALAYLATHRLLRYELLGPRSVEVRQVEIAGAANTSLPTLIPESKVEPVYPEHAKEQRLSCRVILQAVIDRQGNVIDAEVLSATGNDSAAFVESALTAVRQWRYQPAMRDGEPVDVYFTILVSFELEDTPI